MAPKDAYASPGTSQASVPSERLTTATGFRELKSFNCCSMGRTALLALLVLAAVAGKVCSDVGGAAKLQIRRLGHFMLSWQNLLLD